MARTQIDKGYEELMIAIVKQAADDYLETKARLWILDNGLYKGNENQEIVRSHCEADIEEVMKFFRGRFYRWLTTVDSSYLIRKLDERFEEEIIPKIKEKPNQITFKTYKRRES